MKILIVNKFLYPRGGSETYCLSVAKGLRELGHTVEFFGMYDGKNTVGNSADAYTPNMDFHRKSIAGVFRQLEVIYSFTARKQIRKVLDKFAPDTVHLNLFNFQITPSIIYEIKKYSKQTKRKVKIVYTAHDYQLVCPAYLLYRKNDGHVCEECLDGHFGHCVKHRCIHNSLAKSLVGAVEAWLYKTLGTYKHIDVIICPTEFMKSKLSFNKDIKDRLAVRYNPVDRQTDRQTDRQIRSLLR
jgi:hypothetical protein